MLLLLLLSIRIAFSICLYLLFSSLCDLFQFQLQLLLARFSRYASIWRVFPQIFHFSAQLINRPRLLFIYVSERRAAALEREPRATCHSAAQDGRLRIRHVADGCTKARLGLAWALSQFSLSSLVSLFSPLLLLFLSSVIYVKRNAKVQPIGNCQLRANL